LPSINVAFFLQVNLITAVKKTRFIVS
jgi:hypothetical protein